MLLFGQIVSFKTRHAAFLPKRHTIKVSSEFCKKRGKKRNMKLYPFSYILYSWDIRAENHLPVNDGAEIEGEKS